MITPTEMLLLLGTVIALAIMLTVIVLLILKIREQPKRVPLTWDKDKGFNRPPTLGEARMLTPDLNNLEPMSADQFKEKVENAYHENIYGGAIK